MKCIHCEDSFCIAHRHQEDHNCPALIDHEHKGQSVSCQKRQEKIVGIQSGDISTTVASDSIKRMEWTDWEG